MEQALKNQRNHPLVATDFHSQRDSWQEYSKFNQTVLLRARDDKDRTTRPFVTRSMKGWVSEPGNDIILTRIHPNETRGKAPNPQEKRLIKTRYAAALEEHGPNDDLTKYLKHALDHWEDFE